jgi:predicted kinase
MSNRQIKILIGIPGSGKSTWAKQYVLNNADWVRVCRDEFRYALKNQQMCDPKIEDLITTLVISTTRAALNKKLNVIIDATHVRVKYLDAIIEEFKYEADIDYQVFDISVKKAIERDSQRDKKVGAAVIEKMYENYKVLADSFHFQPHKKIERRPIVQPVFNTGLPDAVIFDIDGTLAHMGRRGPFDWDKVDRDSLNHIVAEQIAYHYDNGRRIIIMSGRGEVCRKITVDWMLENGFNWDDFYMRPKDDFRKDNIIKKEIYDNNIKGKYNVLAVYDDRLQVLDMWYKEGIFTFNVNQGNHSF